ncbi:four helix bundle protein [Hydrogenimonas cancrithermarum]|uniref:Four helix bundle protein n=1 Tax=Hydrogenimonas cancrithermarum TaxID=2993563 RepID=A0ABN6WYS3_9BACT|nr:four helix bundle protein [Hydrogenimonas cancrithermarum]BDY13454.1 four helix bundle protein [Hydrogenimonas cancrithermarum]
MRCKNLNVWKKSCRLSVEIYRYFETCKNFGFKDQITRSALSIASNIAEGVEKDSNKETIRFIEIARGSTAELITQTYIGIEIGYIEKKIGLQWITVIEEIANMLGGLKNTYKEKLA